MRIVNVSGAEITDSDFPVLYTVLDKTELDNMINNGDVEVSSSSFPSEAETIQFCEKRGLNNHYIARIEIVAKTV